MDNIVAYCRLHNIDWKSIEWIGEYCFWMSNNDDDDDYEDDAFYLTKYEIFYMKHIQLGV